MVVKSHLHSSSDVQEVVSGTLTSSFTSQEFITVGIYEISFTITEI
jgi:hypothetical protein